MEVILGMKNILLMSPPHAIPFEFNIHHLKRRQNMADFVAALPGYKLFRLARRAMGPIDPAHYLSNIYAYSNIMAIRDNVLGYFSAMYR